MSVLMVLVVYSGSTLGGGGGGDEAVIGSVRSHVMGVYSGSTLCNSTVCAVATMPVDVNALAFC